ncbi:hypothetical protein [Pyxidicoccus xibeiensis]|uniref:hypothetical protein n=1 Tax=Pyxidicoccus xibeiensis TaxID=2906759 RepID=UPI0020A72B7C|nr:hypothetical protein [Pyxidicoccus xibeiensis]MCP3141786.1 hypothetical protein [Pyxidicoccus xibeiensis]
MEFELIEPGHSSVLPEMLFLAVLVGPALWHWLHRSPRNARDVLLSAPDQPAGRLRRFLDFSGWLLQAGLVMLPLSLVLAGMVAADSLKPGCVVGSGPSTYVDIHASWGWGAMLSVAGAIPLVRWLRSPVSPRDVLRLNPRA